MRQTTNYGLKITEGNDDWRNIFDDNADNMDAIDAAIAPMTGATDSTDGTSGVVPEPETGDQNKFLKGDASWAIPGVMTVNGRSPDASGNITVIEHGTAISASSLSALKTNLLAIANTADVNGFIAVKIIPSFTSDGFTSGSTYGGHIYNIYKTNGSTTYFSAIVSNNLGEDVLIGYSNGTWYFNSTKKNIDTISTSLNSIMGDVMARNAGAHNGIYRGKYLGTSVTAEQYTAIRNGTFDDLYIGDYWTIGGHDWVICDFDYYIQCGFGNVTQHHLVMMPSGNMNIPAGTPLYGTSEALELLDGESANEKKWNATSDGSSTHTTAGGYKYSRMRTIIMKAANTIVINAFGSDHVLAFTEVYYNPASETDSGLAGNMADFNDRDQSSLRCRSICDLCNETMVCGQQVWGRGLSNANPGYEIGIDKFQLAIFALNRKFANIRSTWWLRSVSSKALATAILNDGCANTCGPGIAKGVRPRFLLVG